MTLAFTVGRIHVDGCTWRDYCESIYEGDETQQMTRQGLFSAVRHGSTCIYRGVFMFEQKRADLLSLEKLISQHYHSPSPHRSRSLPTVLRRSTVRQANWATSPSTPRRHLL
jgi:hypothetical protein